MQIDVIIATDQRYLPGAEVAAVSLALHARADTLLRVHLFTEKLPVDLFKRFSESVKRVHAETEVHNHPVGESILAGLPKWAGSRMSAVRCRYPQLLPEVDWAIYLDCDVLYLASPEEHYSFRDDSYFAVVTQEQHEPTRLKESKWIGSKLGRSFDASKYFNAGIMLLNLKKMRAEGITEALLAFFEAHKDIASPDQDALNAVCNGKIKIIPAKWNRLQIFLDDTALAERPVIHYVSGAPWLPKLGIVANGRFRLWHAFADRHVWQKKGESLRRLMPKRIIAIKRIEYCILKTRLLCSVFFFFLRLIGKGRYLEQWRRNALEFDVTAGAIAGVAPYED